MAKKAKKSNNTNVTGGIEATPDSGPARYTLPSRTYGIDANEAAEVMITAAEIKKHPALRKATNKVLKAKQKALNSIIK